jgi:hypothetical protein
MCGVSLIFGVVNVATELMGRVAFGELEFQQLPTAISLRVKSLSLHEIKLAS